MLNDLARVIDKKVSVDHQTSLLETLEEKRKSKGKTQDQVAKKAGLDRTVYLRIESGRRPARVGEAIRIAKYLGCAVEEIVWPDAI